MFGRLYNIFRDLTSADIAGRTADHQTLRELFANKKKTKQHIAKILRISWFRVIVRQRFAEEWQRFESKWKHRWALPKILEVIDDPNPRRNWWVDRSRRLRKREQPA